MHSGRHFCPHRPHRSHRRRDRPRTFLFNEYEISPSLTIDLLLPRRGVVAMAIHAWGRWMAVLRVLVVGAFHNGSFK